MCTGSIASIDIICCSVLLVVFVDILLTCHICSILKPNNPRFGFAFVFFSRRHFDIDSRQNRRQKSSRPRCQQPCRATPTNLRPVSVVVLKRIRKSRLKKAATTSRPRNKKYTNKYMHINQMEEDCGAGSSNTLLPILSKLERNLELQGTTATTTTVIL